MLTAKLMRVHCVNCPVSKDFNCLPTPVPVEYCYAMMGGTKRDFQFGMKLMQSEVLLVFCPNEERLKVMEWA
jgi:hypothetical protein